MQTIAHLSDTHLDTSADRLARFTAVLAQIAQLPHVSALVVSGDLADHGAEEEYSEFFDALPAGLPTIVVPGNHDLTAPLQSALQSWGTDGSLNSTLAVDDITIIGLDSHVDRQFPGEFSATTLDFAREALRNTSGPVLLAMHHPPVPVGHHIMDPNGLHSSEELRRLLQDHERIVAVLTGHVHTALATTFAGRPLLGAPGVVSTLRLGSRTDPILDHAAAPGLALHTLDGLSVSTVFHSLSPASW